MSWHARPGNLLRFVSDLIAAEMARLRPGGAGLPPRPWLDTTAVDESGIGLDSLERLQVATALTAALHLHEAGLEDLLLVRRTIGEWLQVIATSLQRFDSRISFHTSGSSGSPKTCSHPLSMLEEEVAHLATLVTGIERVLVAVPCHHIYGFLFTVLLPRQLRCTDIIDVRSRTPQHLERLLRPGDLLVSHPAHWGLLEAHAREIPAGVVGVTSTAPCSEELALSLERRGLRRLIQIYGSSETSGIGWRESPDSPYHLMPFWSHGDGHQQLLRSVPGGLPRQYALQDHLTWCSERLFHVAGRLDDAVQVSGLNVFPALVRQKLLEYPGVADAAVRLMSQVEGARLKAFIVPKPGVDRHELTGALMEWSQSRLSAPERPKAYTLGNCLPRTEYGKLSDWPVASTAQNADQL